MYIYVAMATLRSYKTMHSLLDCAKFLQQTILRSFHELFLYVLRIVASFSFLYVGFALSLTN